MNVKRMMTMLLWLVAIVASANDGVYYVSGSQIVPLKETDVAVTKEVLTITIGDDAFARVDVMYEFTNRGKAKTVDMGFEAAAPYDPGSESDFSKAGKHPEIFDFTVEMNGAKLPIRNFVMKGSTEEAVTNWAPMDLNVWKPNYEDGMGDALVNQKTKETVPFAYAYCFKADFKEGKNVVHHTYRYRMSGGVYQQFSIPYWLKPALRWANHQIDDFTLRIKVKKTAKQFILLNDLWKTGQWRVTSGTGKVHTVKGPWDKEEYLEFSLRDGTVEWHGKNFRPTSDFSINSAESLCFYSDNFKLGRFYDRGTIVIAPYDKMEDGDIYRGTTSGIENKRIIRNLPYASRGYVFKDQKLAAYFKSLWWYMPDPSWVQSTDDFTKQEWDLINKAK